RPCGPPRDAGRRALPRFAGDELSGNRLVAHGFPLPVRLELDRAASCRLRSRFAFGLAPNPLAAPINTGLGTASGGDRSAGLLPVDLGMVSLPARHMDAAPRACCAESSRPADQAPH